jgi:hypothetical protein
VLSDYWCDALTYCSWPGAWHGYVPSLLMLLLFFLSFPFLFSLLFLYVLTLHFLLSAASDTTITGWADAVHTVYSEIVSPFITMCFRLLFSCCLYFFFMLDRFRHNLRNMDYWNLLRVNLEH